MKKILLLAFSFTLLSIAGYAQSKKMSRTKTKPDTVKTYPNGKPIENVGDSKKDADVKTTTSPEKPSSTKNPNSPTNNTNGTKPNQ